MKASVVSVALLAAQLAPAGAAFAAADPNVPVYTAAYAVEYNGKNVGSATFAVAYDAAQDVYEFRWETSAKGLLKLARPNPVVERSRFRVDGGKIRPLEFWHEDGSRKGEENKHVEFDWAKRVAILSDENGRREVRLEDDSVDTGSVQVALMYDLITKGRPGTYRLADADSSRDYVYVAQGETTTQTGVGPLPTRAFMQQHEGSSRSTWLWFAPSLRYLPARIERRKDGEVQTAFTLTSVQGLDARAAGAGAKP